MRVERRFSAMVVFLVLALAGYAESWNQIPAPDSPSARYRPAVVVLDDGRVLRFEGEDYRGDLQNEICGFVGNRWEPLPTTAPPPAQLGVSLTSGIGPRGGPLWRHG